MIKFTRRIFLIMCSIPQKFFQVCRLCLVSIGENDVQTHRLCDESQVRRRLFTDCGCNKNLYNNHFAKSPIRDKNKRFDKSTDDSLPLIISPSDSCLPKNFQHSNSELSKEEKPDIRNNKERSKVKNKFVPENIGDETFQNFDDDSSPSIVIQILRCLSLEVSLGDQLPKLVCCNCLSNLRTLWKFRTMAQEADTVLRNFLMYCKSSNKNISEIGIHFNNMVSSTSWNKSPSEQMAATALTELCNISRKDDHNQNKSPDNELLCSKSEHETIFEQDDNGIRQDLRPSEETCFSECSQNETDYIFRTHLETDAVLTDVSKNVVSISCSNHTTLNHCTCMLNHLKNNNIRIKQNNVSETNTSGTLRNSSTFIHIPDGNNLHTEGILNRITRDKYTPFHSNDKADHLINDCNSPSSITTSEELATDAATTQLWQVLAHSAAKRNECKEASQLLHILNSSFALPKSPNLERKAPSEKPMELVKVFICYLLYVYRVFRDVVLHTNYFGAKRNECKEASQLLHILNSSFALPKSPNLERKAPSEKPMELVKVFICYLLYVYRVFRDVVLHTNYFG
uniref:ZAD domain-containing protein n=1 Tax=Stomoxys calcitrans TaxID=35570 RepID=A0A1I8PZS0_STOCA